MNNSQVKGIYEYTINIPTMFNNYVLKITNHNIITFVGEEFFLEKWCNPNYTNVIDTVSVAKSSESITSNEARKSDTSLNNSTIINFTDLVFENNKTYLKITVNSNVDGNDLTGDDLNDVCEVGLRSKLTDDEYLLLTHDVHTALSLPSSSSIIFDYYLIFNNSSYNYDFTAVSGTKYYVTNIDCDVKYIIWDYTTADGKYVPKLYSRVNTAPIEEGTYQTVELSDKTYNLYIYPFSDAQINDKTLITYKE